MISNIEASQKYWYHNWCLREKAEIWISRLRSRYKNCNIMWGSSSFYAYGFHSTIRKQVEIRYGLTIDVVIPNLLTLKRRPDKSLIVQIIKDVEVFNKISHLEFLQPHSQNIWVISSKQYLTTRYTEYVVFPNFGRHKYSHIIDINKFLIETGDNSFRFVHSRF
jgi:hypothetical protein